MPKTVAESIAPLLHDLIGAELPVRLRGWDGSETGPADAPATITLKNRNALRALVWQPDELGFARAYVAGDIDVDGDLLAALDLPELIETVAGNDGMSFTPKQAARALATAVRLGAIGRRPPLPAEEMYRPGKKRLEHTRTTDSEAISHHYDVGNDFYALVLGPSLVYSCAYYAAGVETLEDAQTAKLELVCRKLGLKPGMRLLDVGCGWGSLVLHAAKHFGVTAIGVTLSVEQALAARDRVEEAGLLDKIEIRVQDYRDVADGPYDAISSIGMSEHVGMAQVRAYSDKLFSLLAPGGRLLNHAISSPPDPALVPEEPRSSFIDRYVFPDGELLSVGHTVETLELAGFEVRDVHSLREHYARTLRGWVENLERNWDACVALTSQGRARVWRLYMVGSSLAFKNGEISIHQVLAVKPSKDGTSGLDDTRDAWAV